MKTVLKLFFIIAGVLISAQNQITVLRSDNSSPIPNAEIYCKDELLGKTNVAGKLAFTTKCRKVQVKASGFYTDAAIVDKVMEVSLSKTETRLQNIETIVLEDKKDKKALEILNKVNQHYRENSPQSLQSYSFKSYEKMSMDFDEDSISHYQEFIAHRIGELEKLPENISDKQRQDSVETLKSMKILTRSQMFLWERAQEYLWSKKYGEKINILDNRISGFQKPIYQLMTFRSNRTEMPKEIHPENRGLYRFYLTDTIEIDGRKNYVIRFREVDYKVPVQKRKFNGYLYVDTETYGLKKIESNSKIKNEGSITSIWTFLNGKWFLKQENFKIKIGNMSLDDIKTDKETGKINRQKKQKFKAYGYLTAEYFDYKSPIKENQDDFKGYTFSVQNSDGKFLEKYRTDSLTAREANTYGTIDSLGKKYGIDRRANTLLSLLDGKIRMKYVDINLGKLVDFSLYEGWRLGLGLKLNEKLNPYISPDFYFAYGFRDSRWKYGAGIDLKTTLEKNSFFRAEYYDDVTNAGQFSKNLWSFRMNMLNMGVNINNDRYYTYQGFKLSYENDLANSLTMNISAKRNVEEAQFDYLFFDRNKVTNFSTLLTFKYSPNSKNIMTPTGKYQVESGFPEVYFNYEQSLKAFGGDLNFSKFDVLLTHSLKTKAGISGIRIFGGLVGGQAPIWHNFIMNGMASRRSDLNFNLSTYLGFATMEGGKYYSDRFAGYYVTQEIPWYFKSFGKNISSFNIIYKGMIGEMKHPEYHQLEFEKLNHLYQEVGVEYSNFLSSYFNLGLFYRIGYYDTSRFFDNFAVQFKLKLLGF